MYGQFAVIGNLQFGRMVYKTYIFININLFFLLKLKAELKCL